MAPTSRMLWLIFTALFVVISTSSSVDTKTYIIHMDNHKASEQLDSFNNDPLELYREILLSTRTLATTADDSEALEPEILYTYMHTMTGFSAKLTLEQHQLLTDMDGVLHVVPDGIRRPQTTYSPYFLGLDQPGSAGLSSVSNLRQPASDVIVGFVDTGIWPEHASFSDKGLPPVPSRWKGTCEEGTNFTAANCNKKLIGARAFFKGYEANYGRINETTGYRSARDSEGHGTHTASIAAGNTVPNASFFGIAKGVARGISYTSRIAAYRVCWNNFCSNSDILAAIDQAVSDGVDILSLSLIGEASPYYQDSAMIAAFGAAQKGVFVSYSAGNTGPFPSTVNNVAPWVMTVAASSLDRGFLGQVKLSNGKTFRGASLFSANQKKTKQLRLVYKETAGRNKTSAEYCLPGSLSPSLVKGKIVICKCGFNDDVEKGTVVKSAGGSAMILLDVPLDGEQLAIDPHVLPAVLLGASEVRSFESYISQHKNLTASINFLGTTFGARSPGVGTFSSRGPNPVDPNIIKPDITAPGINILAAWPPISSISEQDTDNRRADFNILSGTSMSCPHVSGVAALVKSVHRDWSPAAIKSAIMTSSYTHDNTGKLISDFSESSESKKFATPFALGSGHVNPNKALEPGLVYDITGEDYLQYLCSINYTDAQVTIISRRNYTCPKGNVLQPGDLNYPSFAVLFDAARKGNTATITYKRTVTNVGTANTTYKVLLDQPKGVKISVIPKVLNFKELGEKKSYKICFADTSDKVTGGNNSSFGSLVWVGVQYTVRSPIAVTWLSD